MPSPFQTVIVIHSHLIMCSTPFRIRGIFTAADSVAAPERAQDRLSSDSPYPSTRDSFPLRTIWCPMLVLQAILLI